ncbi:hypothetical protein CTA1_7826 [Colletotrichum tanaceti]|uniref:Uncharacterized protein n=1 Tax=Colletotrichum tanaceti TaxID=1306861 RepID=A0A4U6XUF3_9PEZI|nr:hypothetical protein CTA1_7826 [Colletotrichum tanaceti]
MKAVNILLSVIALASTTIAAGDPGAGCTTDLHRWHWRFEPWLRLVLPLCFTVR